MAQTNILLEAGTNELEIVEFFIDEPTASSFTADAPEASGHYRGYYGVNVAKVLEIIRLPKVTGMPEVSHPSVLGAFNLRNHIIPLVDLSVCPWAWARACWGEAAPVRAAWAVNLSAL